MHQGYSIRDIYQMNLLEFKYVIFRGSISYLLLYVIHPPRNYFQRCARTKLGVFLATVIYNTRYTYGYVYDQRRRNLTMQWKQYTYHIPIQPTRQETELFSTLTLYTHTLLFIYRSRLAELFGEPGGFYFLRLISWMNQPTQLHSQQKNICVDTFTKFHFEMQWDTNRPLSWIKNALWASRR